MALTIGELTVNVDATIEIPARIPYENFKAAVVALGISPTARGIRRITIDTNGVTVEQLVFDENGNGVVVGSHLAVRTTQIGFIRDHADGFTKAESNGVS